MKAGPHFLQRLGLPQNPERKTVVKAKSAAATTKPSDPVRAQSVRTFARELLNEFLRSGDTRRRTRRPRGNGDGSECWSGALGTGQAIRVGSAARPQSERPKFESKDMTETAPGTWHSGLPQGIRCRGWALVAAAPMGSSGVPSLGRFPRCYPIPAAGRRD